jgi:hypothetical protein
MNQSKRIARKRYLQNTYNNTELASQLADTRNILMQNLSAKDKQMLASDKDAYRKLQYTQANVLEGKSIPDFSLAKTFATKRRVVLQD